MKNSDYAMLILIASISLLISYFVVSSIPALKDANQPRDVQVIDEYSAEIVDLDTGVFNKDAINPTVGITIGNGQTPE